MTAIPKKEFYDYSTKLHDRHSIIFSETLLPHYRIIALK